MYQRTPVHLNPAVIGGDLASLSSHPDYAAAKAGDVESAVRLARAIVTDDLVQRVRDMIGESDPIVVPVVSEEASGRNKIPLAAAEVLAERLGVETTGSIGQRNAPRRTAMSGRDRIFASPVFDGDVVAGRDYLILDDTLTQGATFAALSSHIEAGGGRVVGALALTGKQYSAKLQPDPETLTALREKHGDLEQEFIAATGHGFDSLTESEARYLTNFKPAERLRVRILDEGRRGRARADQGTSQDVGREQRDLDRVAARIQAVIDAARSPGHAPQKAETGTAADWVLDAARDVGLDLDGYSHVIDGSAVRHIFKKHGVEGVEQTRGQIAVKDQDILSIGTIIGDPDAVAFGTKTAQHKDAVIYAKIMPDGTTTVVEELRTGRSEAAVVSMWKRPAAKDPDALSRILLSYARSDGGTPIKVVTKADGVKEQRDLSSLKASLSRSKGRALGMIGKDGWKTTTALFSNWLSDAMGKDERWNALGLVPGRALFAELGKNLPAAAEYLGLKERMDADRNDWQARSAKMVDKWTAAVLTPRETDGQRVHRGVQQQA